MIFCQGCGKEIHRTASKCPQCGYSRLRGKRYKSKLAAGLLGIFIGGFGVHRFYLGQWWGVFYLLLCWTGIPGLVSLVEGIVFLATDQERWDEKFNEGIGGGEGSSGAGVVIAVVVGIGGIMMIGILAAIAIPAYQDYTMRAKVMGALQYATGAQAAVAEYVASTRTLPSSLRAAGFDAPTPKDVGSIEWDERIHAIVITMRGAVPIEGKAIALQMDTDAGDVVWQCMPVDMPNKYLPVKCRDANQR